MLTFADPGTRLQLHRRGLLCAPLRRWHTWPAGVMSRRHVSSRISWSMSWSLGGGVALVTALLPQSCYRAIGRRTTTLSCWPVLLRPLKECRNCNLYASWYFAEGAAPYTVTDGQQTVTVQMAPWLVQQFFHSFLASNIFFQHTASLLRPKQWCKIFCCNGFVDDLTFFT